MSKSAQDQFVRLYDPERIADILEDLMPGWREREDKQFSQTERTLLNLSKKLTEGMSYRSLRNTTEMKWPPIESALRDQFPHFADVIDQIRDAWYLSHHSGAGLQIPPLLLMGDPGLGKTFFAKRLAQLLQLEHRTIQMATTTAGFVLSGMSISWSDAKPGILFTQLLKGYSGNPLLILDEIDKVMSLNNHDALGPLYGLLEWHSAQTFCDEYFPLPFNASRIQWIATANDLAQIPEPIQSRMQVITIRYPDLQERQHITDQIYQYLRDARPWGWILHHQLDPQVRDQIAERYQTPRDIRQALEKLCGTAASSQSSLDTDNDQTLQPGMEHLDCSEPKNPVFGFVGVPSSAPRQKNAKMRPR